MEKSFNPHDTEDKLGVQKMSQKELQIQISRAESDMWKLVKDILKIPDGESGTLKVRVIESKDNHVILQITKLPKLK